MPLAPPVITAVLPSSRVEEAEAAPDMLKEQKIESQKWSASGEIVKIDEEEMAEVEL